MTSQLTHEPDAQRYTLRIGDELVAVVDYRRNGGAVSFTHTYTAPARRGRGHAAELVAFAIADIERTTDLRVVPMCWYVAEWFAQHPEHERLLTR